MSRALAEMTTESLQAFADAWNRHDLDALMSFMTDDCVFESSAGPDAWGTRSKGSSAVRAAYAEVWATFPDAHWGNARHFVCGDCGVSEWTFTGTRRDGTRIEVHGCDLFTFRDGMIAVKNSYRKNRPPLTSPENEMALPDVKQFSTEDLDALRDAIALERIKRKPEVTMNQPITMEAAVDPRWYITLGEQGTFLQLRHPGYGWVGYLLPPPSRAQLASSLLHHALMPAPKADSPKPDVSAGGGTVH